MRIRTERRVHVITFAPHTIQVFKVLDLTLFRVLTEPPRRERRFADDNAMVKVSMNVCHDFEQTIGYPNIWGAFQGLGLEFDFHTKSEPHRLFVDREKLRGSAGFREL
jgi:hypothetical protein